jgi:hypothetical protein
MNLVDRAKNMLLSPEKEWEVIDDEDTSVGGLYIGYIIPLAAIGPVAKVIGMATFGISVASVGTFRVPIGAALRQGIVQYVMALVGVFVLALIIEALAPYFRGKENRLQALKVAAYSSTAAWVVGIVGLIPALSILGLLGLYSLYLLYLGLPTLMKVPEDKAMGYTVVVMICAVGLFFVIGVIVAQLGGGPVIEAQDLLPSANTTGLPMQSGWLRSDWGEFQSGPAGAYRFGTMGNSREPSASC